MKSILGNDFKEGQLIVVGGRPGMGKTSFAIAIARQYAKKYKKPVLYFSAECSEMSLMERIVRFVKYGETENGDVTELEKRNVFEHVNEGGAAPIMIDESDCPRFEYIRHQCLNEYTGERTPGLIIIDYLQIINSYLEEGEASLLSRLKNLAMELHTPIVVLSQLDRKVDKRDDHRPKLTDFMEVDNIETIADVVILLYRDAYYQPDLEVKDKEELIIFRKDENGNETRTVAAVSFRDGYFRDCFL